MTDPVASTVAAGRTFTFRSTFVRFGFALRTSFARAHTSAPATTPAGSVTGFEFWIVTLRVPPVASTSVVGSVLDASTMPQTVTVRTRCRLPFAPATGASTSSATRAPTNRVVSFFMPGSSDGLGDSWTTRWSSPLASQDGGEAREAART